MITRSDALAVPGGCTVQGLPGRQAPHQQADDDAAALALKVCGAADDVGDLCCQPRELVDLAILGSTKY